MNHQSSYCALEDGEKWRVVSEEDRFISNWTEVRLSRKNSIYVFSDVRRLFPVFTRVDTLKFQLVSTSRVFMISYITKVNTGVSATLQFRIHFLLPLRPSRKIARSIGLRWISPSEVMLASKTLYMRRISSGLVIQDYLNRPTNERLPLI